MEKKNPERQKTIDMNRRSFIKSATAGAALFATASVGPWFVPARTEYRDKFQAA